MTTLCRRTPYVAMTIYQDAETANYEAGTHTITIDFAKIEHVIAFEQIEGIPIASDVAASR